jgi:hypothetical protein
MKKFQKIPSSCSIALPLKDLAMTSCFISLLIFSQGSYATDLLAGTMTDAVETLGGSGKKWMYILDVAISIGAYVKTKNPLVFFSVLGIALVVPVLLKIIGP